MMTDDDSKRKITIKVNTQHLGLIVSAISFASWVLYWITWAFVSRQSPVQISLTALWLLSLRVSCAFVTPIKDKYLLTPGPVSTWMGDRLQAVKPSWYVASHPGQLSLAIPPWVGAVSTSESWDINRHTARCGLAV